jgi:mRNA-degrading endonuclease toxin of MazEF toxin-antitoxin module
VNKGLVVEYVIGNQQARVVLVSASRYNPGRATFAVIRQPTGAPPPPSVTVVTEPGDAVAGVVDLTRLRPLDPDSVRRRVGALTATTMRRVDTTLRNYLDL